MVELEPLELDDREWLFEVIARHRELTDSALASYLLSDWGAAVGRFRKVMPRDYKRVMSVMREAEQGGVSLDEAHGRVMVAAHACGYLLPGVEARSTHAPPARGAPARLARG